MNKKIEILRCIVGSQAHGLATPESDFDYRGVFIVPTSELLKIGGDNIEQTTWIEGKTDDTGWELKKFLFLATKCNPTILETFLAPIVPSVSSNPKIAFLGEELQALFPYIWNSKEVKDAFCGYGKNQEKKFLDKKDNRAHKYAAAYLRTLYNAYELLNTGTFTVRIADTEIGETVRRFKNKEYTIGEVMQTCTDWREKVEVAYDKNPKKETDIEPVNEFLLKVRKDFWQ